MAYQILEKALKGDFSIVKNKIPKPDKVMYQLRPILSIDEVFDKLGSRPQVTSKFMDEIEEFGHVANMNWVYLAWNPYPNSPEQWFGNYFFYPKDPNDNQLDYLVKELNEIRNGMFSFDRYGPISNEGIDTPQIACLFNVLEDLEFYLTLIDQKIKRHPIYHNEEIRDAAEVVDTGSFLEQIAAIEILAHNGENMWGYEAKEFLNNLAEYTLSIRLDSGETEVLVPCYYRNDRGEFRKMLVSSELADKIEDNDYSFSIDFPNAKGELKERLGMIWHKPRCEVYPFFQGKEDVLKTGLVLSNYWSDLTRFVFNAAARALYHAESNIDVQEEVKRISFFVP